MSRPEILVVSCSCKNFTLCIFVKLVLQHLFEVFHRHQNHIQKNFGAKG